MVASKVAAAVRIIVEIQQEGVAATQLARSAMPNTTPVPRVINTS